MPAPEKRRKKSAVTVQGPWVAIPLDFLASRACAELSPHATKLLFDMCGQLGPNARGNGDLSAAPAVLAPKGWTSTETRRAAIDELLQARLLCITRRGNRRSCTLYAVTLWPMDCDFSKLDHGPGAYSSRDWRSAKPAIDERPTIEQPARWAKVRKNEKSAPATGQPALVMHPPRDKQGQAPPSYAPATGSKRPIPPFEVVPPRDTYLDKPSAALAA